ncbi:hypothetical protein [Bacillus sp. UMB0728]|uniref:hypothetical protein n=1 Tax=Bacillus sp. UMB0728 TaxID=2066052 RepID=UPI000C774FCC|nr:hypothetical protein [Bacillus sp. UMB0728]PLR70458.1 hypothetical protein CYJ37_23260 [Bacillus sp. UMB0728]
MEYQQKMAIYKEIMNSLTDPFPEGTVEVSDNRSSIPVQAYIQRLEEKAGGLWSWRITGEPIIFENEDQVLVKGVLSILDVNKEGMGFSNLQRYTDTGKIKNLKNAILSAESDALRKACDRYRIGWQDLAPYRSWGSNPGVEIKTPHKTGKIINNDRCIKCDNPLTAADIKVLEEFNVRLKYCQEDLPANLKKRRGN